MTMRFLKLPDDMIPLAELIAKAFQYPENKAWSVQTDEKEQIIESMKKLNSIWPLIRMVQLLSPPLRDIMRGYVWEEDGQLVGVTTVQRRGSTDVWIVGTVGVLPAYRRHGIARKLVEAGLNLIRECGGKKAFLSVIDGNLPAYKLYESLGFEHYSSSTDFNALPRLSSPEPTLPEGYTLSPLSLFDWQPRYELEKRISPQNLLKYEPVEVGRFRQPVMMRVLSPLLMSAQGTREAGFAIYTASEGRIVAYGGYTLPIRGKGLSIFRARLDPDCPELAPFMVVYLLHKAATLSPDHRIEFPVPNWLEAIVTAAEEAGFKRRVENCYMGLEL